MSGDVRCRVSGMSVGAVTRRWRCAEVRRRDVSGRLARFRKIFFDSKKLRGYEIRILNCVTTVHFSNFMYVEYAVRGTAGGSGFWHPRVCRFLHTKWGPAHRQQLRPQMSNRCISGLYHLEK